MRAALRLLPGVVSDDTTFGSEGRIADVNNMRFWRGQAQTIGGWSKLTDGISGVCRNVLPWTDLDAYTNIAFGTHTKLYVHVNGALSDITPTTGFTAGSEHGAGGPGYSSGAYGSGDYGEGSVSDYFPLTWSLANWGEFLLASPRNQTLNVWQNDTGTAAAAVADAPDQITCFVMSPFKRQVIAGGCSDHRNSGVFNPTLIRWCDLEDYTNWTPATDNNAGFFPLPASGRIVQMKPVGDYIAIWTDSELYMGTYQGDPGNLYRFERLAGNCGLIGPNAVQVIGQTAYWISPDFQFRVWTPGTEPNIIPCPIRNDFKDNAAQGQNDKITATSVGQYGEVWWYYADSRDGLECSRYIAVSTQDGTWFRGQLARSGVVDAGPTQFPLFVTPTGTAYWHETGNTADGGALEWSLTSADQYIEEGGRYVTLHGMEPDFEDQKGAVSLTLLMRAYPQDDTVYEKGPFALPAGKRKSYFQCSGRVFTVKFSGNSSPAFARFGKPVFDVKTSGEE